MEIVWAKALAGSNPVPTAHNMSYTEANHPHQSDTLRFLSPDYVPYAVDDKGKKTWGVISFKDGKWEVSCQNEVPAYGGYIARESIYGNPTYCPNATFNHRKHLALYGTMSHLVFFDSEESAVNAGFRPCKRCLKK